jgi:Ca2+-binding RTX toxin-like protein
MGRTAFVTVLLGMLIVPASAAAGRVDVVYKGQFSEFTGKAEVEYSGYEVRFTASPGEANRVTVSAGALGAGTRFEDSGAPIDPGPNCRGDMGAVVCTTPNATGRIVGYAVELGDGDDSARLDHVAATVTGGPGADAASIADDETYQHLLLAFDGGPGPDTVRAEGTAHASMSYADRTAPVHVTLDGQPNDGEVGEGDTLGPGTDTVTGGGGADVLDATGGLDATFKGGAGPDRVVGGDGDDHLDGDDGDDVVSGGPGDDWALGDNGDDTVEGGAGADHLAGYGVRNPPPSERDALDGGDGPDEFFASGGSADDVRGGPGMDTANYADVDTRPLHVTLDDRPGDGLSGEQDNVHSDVEGIKGAQGDDHLVGNDGPNTLDGGEGRNVLEGLGGDDRLLGSFGSAGSVLDGGPGADVYTSIFTSDEVHARDGEHDTIECASAGGGRFEVDRLDTSSGCAPTSPFWSQSKVRLDRRGRGRVTLRCSEFVAIHCAGRLVLVRGRRVAVVRRGFDVRPRVKPYSVELRLSARWQRVVRRRGKLAVTARVETRRDAPPERRIEERRWTLVAPRR